MNRIQKGTDWFLGALAVGLAARVLFRRSGSPQPAPATSFGAPATQTRKQWAGSLLRTIRAEVRQDETVIVAAALAFYAMLALFSAAFAAVSIYGLVLDPADVTNQITTITDVLPLTARGLVAEQIEALATTSSAGLSIGLAVSLLAALWVASGGTRSLLHGINIVYNVEDRRSWLLQRALAYGLTLGFIIFGLGTIAVVTFLPDWLEDLGFGSTGVLFVEIAALARHSCARCRRPDGLLPHRAQPCPGRRPKTPTGCSDRGRPLADCHPGILLIHRLSIQLVRHRVIRSARGRRRVAGVVLHVWIRDSPRCRGQRVTGSQRASSVARHGPLRGLATS